MRSINDGIEGTVRDEPARVALAGVLRDVLAAARWSPLRARNTCGSHAGFDASDVTKLVISRKWK
jgi:hypothetical protein